MPFCPHCGGDLAAFMAGFNKSGASAPTPAYNQTKVWQQLKTAAEAIAGDPPELAELADRAAQRVVELCRDGGPVKTVIHMIFDRSIVPDGGVLYRAMMLEGRNVGMDIERFRAMGYAVVDGKVLMVDDVPVGRGYSALQYWGGEKQHKRWHLQAPVAVELSRNGDPFFMDDKLLAFGAVWNDSDRAGEAIATLLSVFDEGVNKEGRIATPVLVEIRKH